MIKMEFFNFPSTDNYFFDGWTEQRTLNSSENYKFPDKIDFCRNITTSYLTSKNEPSEDLPVVLINMIKTNSASYFFPGPEPYTPYFDTIKLENSAFLTQLALKYYINPNEFTLNNAIATRLYCYSTSKGNTVLSEGEPSTSACFRNASITFPQNMVLAYLFGSFNNYGLTSLGAYLLPRPRKELIDSNPNSHSTISFDDSNDMDWHNAKFPKKINLFVSQGINALQTEYSHKSYPVNKAKTSGSELCYELKDQEYITSISYSKNYDERIRANYYTSLLLHTNKGNTIGYTPCTTPDNLSTYKCPEGMAVSCFYGSFSSVSDTSETLLTSLGVFLYPYKVDNSYHY